MDQWAEILQSAHLEESVFLRNLFDPDFFLYKKIPNYTNLKYSRNLNDFLGTKSLYGPIADQMAFVDMRMGRKKLFRGTLNAFLGKETFFPLVNSELEAVVFEAVPEQVILFCIEETTGLVINGTLETNNFSADLFHITLKEIQIKDYQKTLITGFEVERSRLNNGKMDAVVLSRSAFAIKY